MSEQTITHAPTDHHPLGPSNFPMWSECPCYEGNHNDDDSDEESTDAKGRGTAKHLALAKALTGDPDAFAGLSEDEEREVRWVAETVVESARYAGYTPNEFVVERRLTLYNPDFSVLYFGTADIGYGPFLEDAKFGEERNYFAQMCGYALPKMERDNITTVQARIRYGRLHKTVYHVIERRVAEAVVYRILAARNDPQRKPKACQYCGWCKHMATCSETNAKVNILLDKRPDWGFRIPTMQVSQAGADPVIVGAMRFIWKSYIEKWGEALDTAAAFMADNGNVPLGFTKRDERGRLEFNEKTFDALIAMGLPEEAVKSAANFSLTSLGKAYASAFGVSEGTGAKRVEAALVAANAAARGPSTFKLIMNKDAESEIRSVLARDAEVLPLPEPKEVTNLK